MDVSAEIAGCGQQVQDEDLLDRILCLCCDHDLLRAVVVDVER